MNTLVQRYLPPALVLGAAAFFAWPPAATLDLGEDVIRATSVRWRPADLAAPPRIELTSDPFADILVAEDPVSEADQVAVEEIPLGPPADELKAGLKLDGFANMARRRWAVVNGRPRLPGDSLRTNDANRHDCRLESIENNSIVVRCEGTITEIHLRAFGSQKSNSVSHAPDAPAVQAPAVQAPDSPAAIGGNEIPPPPQA